MLATLHSPKKKKILSDCRKQPRLYDPLSFTGNLEGGMIMQVDRLLLILGFRFYLGFRFTSDQNRTSMCGSGQRTYSGFTGGRMDVNGRTGWF